MYHHWSDLQSVLSCIIVRIGVLTVFSTLQVGDSYSLRPYINHGFSVFNGALIIYDILITLADEIELVWKSGWNVLKVLYLCQRYLTIFDIAAYAHLRNSL